MKSTKPIVNLHQNTFNEFSFFSFSTASDSVMRIAYATYASQRSFIALLQINMLHLLRLIHSILWKEIHFVETKHILVRRWIFDSKLVCNKRMRRRNQWHAAHHTPPNCSRDFVDSNIFVHSGPVLDARVCRVQCDGPALLWNDSSCSIVYDVRWRTGHRTKSCLSQTLNNRGKTKTKNEKTVFSRVALPYGRRLCPKMVLDSPYAPHSRIMKK